MSAPPTPRKGALQSLQRGAEGSAPLIRRMVCRRGTWPVSIARQSSSGVGLATCGTVHSSPMFARVAFSEDHDPAEMDELVRRLEERSQNPEALPHAQAFVALVDRESGKSV